MSYDLLPDISIRRGGIRFDAVLEGHFVKTGRDRYLARINRPRCPRSPKWRRGTKHATGLSQADWPSYHQRFNELGFGRSIFDAGTNHRVPSGPRRAASRAHKLG